MALLRQDSNSTSDEHSEAPRKRVGIPVSRRFTIAVAALVLLCMSVFWLISNYNTQNLLRQQANSLGPALATQTANLVTELVLANDRLSMTAVLGQLTRGSTIVEAAVLDVDGEVVAISTNEVEPPGSLLPFTLSYGEYEAPILLDQGSAGSVRIRLDLSYIEAGTNNNLLFVAIAALIIIVIATALSINYFQYLVSFPLRLLNFALQNVRYGEVESCPEPKYDNEIAKLIRQYNSTAEFLAKYTFIGAPDDELAMPDAQVSREKISSATLCIHLGNFEYLASTRDEETLVALLNRYYFLAENIGKLYNGVVSQCADGEVVLDFNRGSLEEEQCFYAICAGQLFIRLLSTLTSIPGRAPVDAKFRLAVHYGDFAGGLYSPLTGSYDNVTGMTLDITRLICRDCPDNSLLVSATAYEQAGGDSRVVGEEFSVLEADQPIRIYLCSNALTSYRQLLNQQAEKLTRVLSGEPSRKKAG